MFTFESFGVSGQNIVIEPQPRLQGTSVDNPKLNKILFSRTGVDKFISSYVSENKLTMVVALESIIKTGKFEGEFELTKNRKDGIVKFYRISKEVNIGNSSHKTSLLIGEDRNGKRFYNLNINADTYSKDEAPKGFSPNMVRPIGANRQLLATKDDIHSSDLEVNIFVKPLINNGCGFNPFTQDSWDEDKHPRGDDGRFGSGGKKKESDNNAIEISGNELGEYKDIKELRQKAFQYYKNNLQGQTAQRKDIGEIRFSKKGLNETISHSNEDKLLMIPLLKNIIEKGKCGKEEQPKHPRRDEIVAFIPITNVAVLKGKQINVEVLIGKDKQGNLYYDIFTNNFRQKTFNDKKTPPTGAWDNSPSSLRALDRNIVSTDNIIEDTEKINIFIEPLINNGCCFNPFTQDSWDEDKHPRGDDGRFGSGGKKESGESKSNKGKEPFGKAYKEYSHKPEKAIEHLLKVKNGHVPCRNK